MRRPIASAARLSLGLAIAAGLLTFGRAAAAQPAPEKPETIGVGDWQLAPLFEPKKFTPAEVQYVDVAGIVRGAGKDSAGALLAHLRNTDVLLLVVRAWQSSSARLATSVQPNY